MSSRTDRATQRNPVSKTTTTTTTTTTKLSMVLYTHNPKVQEIETRRKKKKKKKGRRRRRRRGRKEGSKSFVPVTSAFTSAGTAQQSLVSQSKVKRTRTL